jgi:hypothetical protein
VQINIQATVDHTRRFTSFDMGWPGSVADVTMWTSSFIWQNRHAHFGNFPDNQMLLADKGQ